MNRFFLKLFRRGRLNRDIEAELAFHREMSSQNGNPMPLGNTAVIKEQAFDLWRFNFPEDLWRDLIYAARGLRRSPALVVSALLSLGLGIGVNTTMFSLGIEFLFSQPSVRDAGSLVSVRLGGNSNAPEKVIDFLRASQLFEDVAGEEGEAYANFNDGAETHRVFSVFTTPNYFAALGVPMLYGRGFIPSDPKEATVLQYRFWRKYFQGDPSVVGRIINLDGRPCTVVGILPEHHRTLLGFGFSPDLYIPRYLEDTTLQMYARLRPGMTLAEARTGLVTVAKRMDREMPTDYKYAESIRVSPIAGYAHLSSEDSLLTIGIFFAILLGVTGLVLLIACVNVANLLLARGSARRSEIATRLALGADRARLVQQLLAESLLLSLMGAALGFFLSQFTASLLARIHLPLPVPIILQITSDWRVACYAALITTFTALACGLLPAFQSVKESIAPDLHRGQRMRLRRVLVAAQVAISVVVLTAGFVFLRNLTGASAISPGFDVTHTLLADVNLPPSGYGAAERKSAYIDRTVRTLAALPGIEQVAAARIAPFNNNSSFMVNLKFPDNGQKIRAYFCWNAITTNYFAAMGIPLISGRTFSSADHGVKVVIVNSTFARQLLGGRTAVGTEFAWNADGKTLYRVVGVVEGTKTITIGEEQKAQIYEPLDQIDNDRLQIEFMLRSAIPPALQLPAVRRALHDIEPMAGAEVETMFSSIGLAFLPSQVGAVLMGTTGFVGLLLAMIGLYGVMAYSVTRRTREIAVRIAVGATRGDISRLILRDSARLILIGCGIGLIVAVFVTKPLAMFLVAGLKPADPLNFAVVLTVMLLTGLISAWGPVRRAIAVDPNVSLRVD